MTFWKIRGKNGSGSLLMVDAFFCPAWPLVIGSGGCGLLHGACARAALRSRWRGSSRYHFRSLSTCCAVVKLAVPAAFDVGGSSGLNIVAPNFANDGNGPLFQPGHEVVVMWSRCSASSNRPAPGG